MTWGCGWLCPARERKWDLIEAHDSVAILLYHLDLDAVLIVRQFRPAVYATQLRRANSEGLHDPPFSNGKDILHHCELSVGRY